MMKLNDKNVGEVFSNETRKLAIEDLIKNKIMQQY